MLLLLLLLLLLVQLGHRIVNNKELLAAADPITCGLDSSYRKCNSLEHGISLSLLYYCKVRRHVHNKLAISKSRVFIFHRSSKYYISSLTPRNSLQIDEIQTIDFGDFCRKQSDSA